MKLSNKRRLENLEKAQAPKKGRPRSAMVIFDACIRNFDIKALSINADRVVIVPDSAGYAPKGSYKVSYHY